jgi:hypothetical protein
MLNRIYHTGRNLASPDAWKTHIIFRVGAVIVGLVAIAFAETTEISNDVFHASLVDRWPYGPLPICPAGLARRHY